MKVSFLGLLLVGSISVTTSSYLKHRRVSAVDSNDNKQAPKNNDKNKNNDNKNSKNTNYNNNIKSDDNNVDSEQQQQQQLPKKELRIVGGKPVTTPNEYPYFGFPVGKDNCGAVLIHDDIMVSSAHCEGFFNEGVFLGGNRIDGKTSTKKDIDFDVVHPDYSNDTLANDIMLIKLSKSSNAVLAELNTDESHPSLNEGLEILGYGATSEHGSFSEVLQRTKVLTAPDFKCADLYKRFRSDSMICSWFPGGGRDSCSGDSGGAVLLTGTNVLVGLVSFGEGCAREDVPSVNTDISYYADFIHDGICKYSSKPLDDCDPSLLGSTPTISTVSLLNGTESYVSDGNETTSLLDNNVTSSLFDVNDTSSLVTNITATLSSDHSDDGTNATLKNDDNGNTTSLHDIVNHKLDDDSNATSSTDDIKKDELKNQIEKIDNTTGKENDMESALDRNSTTNDFNDRQKKDESDNNNTNTTKDHVFSSFVKGNNDNEKKDNTTKVEKLIETSSKITKSKSEVSEIAGKNNNSSAISEDDTNNHKDNEQVQDNTQQDKKKIPFVRSQNRNKKENDSETPSLNVIKAKDNQDIKNKN